MSTAQLWPCSRRNVLFYGWKLSIAVVYRGNSCLQGWISRVQVSFKAKTSVLEAEWLESGPETYKSSAQGYGLQRTMQLGVLLVIIGL